MLRDVFSFVNDLTRMGRPPAFATRIWMLEHIIVSTDLSDASLHALRHAAYLTRASRNSHITLVHVNTAVEWEPLKRFRSDQHLAQIKAERIQRGKLLDAQLASIKHLGVRATARLLDGRPAAKLMEFAENNNGSLLVLTKRSPDNLKRWLLGSVTRRIVRQTQIPTLLLEGAQPLPNPAALRYDRILATTDFSKDSQRGLEQVVGLARALEAEVLLTHIFKRRLGGPSLPGIQSMVWDNELLEALEREVEEAMDTSIRALPQPYDAIRKVVRTAESICDILLELCEEEDIGLVAMPSHGKGAMAAALMGSNTERVLRLSSVPMLILPPAQ